MNTSTRLLLVSSMLSCAGPTPAASTDPCEPSGHIHREPSGDWCHCDRGFKARDEGLGCVEDPNFTGRLTIELSGSDERACWHASRGPFMSAGDGASIDQFLTLYTTSLPARPDGLHSATTTYRAAVSGPHVLSLSRGVNVEIRERLPGGTTKEVAVLVTRAISRCEELSQQFGFELVNRAEYVFQFGPSQRESVSFILDQVE